MKPVTFTSKLGTTRAGPRSRVWLEGARLTAAGFTPGMTFEKDWTASGRLTLTLIPEGQHVVPAVQHNVAKVSGKGAKPIIDITGARVFDHFGALGERVSVTYRAGYIIIEGGAA